MVRCTRYNINNKFSCSIMSFFSNNFKRNNVMSEICFHFGGHRSMSSTQDFSAGPSEFLPDLHFLWKIVLKPSNVIPLLLFLSSRALYVFNFISTGRGLKIRRPVTIQNKPKSWSHAPKKSSQIQLGIPSNFEKFTRFKT